MDQSLITPMDDIDQMWEKLPEEYTTHIEEESPTPGRYRYNETTYKYSILPAQFVKKNVFSLNFEPRDNDTEVNRLINKKKDNDFSIHNEKLLDYIFEPKIIPENNVDEGYVCTIKDGYVVNKYTYTGKDGEIEESVDECLKYNNPEEIEKRKRASDEDYLEWMKQLDRQDD